MGVGLVAMSRHPGYLRFQRGNARIQLLARVGIKAFLREQAGGVSAPDRTVIVIHHQQYVGCVAFRVNRRLEGDPN